jgi:hypothetical protein
MTDSDSSWFSLKRFTVALGTVALGTAGGITILPAIGGFLGTLLGGFAAGLAFKDRPLLECGTAGLLSGVGALVVAMMGDGLIGIITGIIKLIGSPQTLLLFGVLSFGLAALGAHFGNDFRDGLTQSVDSDHGGLDDL